jgi:signal transduction histidine kinase
MIVDRLRVRGKLNLLLMLPLTAVVLVTVPFVAGQIGNARSSTATADAARAARQLGGLVWELQRERLVTADYLADPTADDAAMLLQFQAVSDSAEALRRSLGPHPSDELDSALVRLGSLTELRESARSRGIALDSVARAYHAVIEALIDALRLVPQRTTDAEGTRQLTALDALLRANEESALRGMALVAAAVSPQVGRDILTTASAQSQMFTERFVQQADADQAALVVLVDQGAAAHRVDALVQHLPDPGNPDSVRAFVAGARDAADAQASLRRLVQDQVTSQIAGAAGGRAGTARAAAWSVSVGAILLLALVLGLAVMVSRSIARPLQRLTRAATTTADLAGGELVRVTDVEGVDEQPPRLAAIDVASGDEVGELAVAFNRVQTTAALLLERQVVTRRNVSLMFATVAQRTQNLVRRQLALVDELEKDEQNTRLLSRLYRLDHLSTRLRRSAENLLVVAGSRTETRISAPTPLTTVLRSALAEIEDYQRVNFGTVQETTIVAPLVADLVLVFAELLENATSFSPPGSTVDVLATPTTGGWCQVSVIDRGIGMTAERLAEENRRLVERERLDIVPTSVLGLFVVGRLARRHGLTIALVPTPGGGTTATVAIPPGLHNAAAQPARTPVALPRRPVLTPPVPVVPVIPAVPGTFPWFARVTDPNGGLQRRVPGAQLPAATVRMPETGRTPHDATAARTTMDALQTALTRAENTTAAPVSLTRRTPGANLAPGLRTTTPGAAVRRHTPSPRNPEAERAAFDGFVAGLAEADRQVEKKGTS